MLSLLCLLLDSVLHLGLIWTTEVRKTPEHNSSALSPAAGTASAQWMQSYLHMENTSEIFRSRGVGIWPITGKFREKLMYKYWSYHNWCAIGWIKCVKYHITHYCDFCCSHFFHPFTFSSLINTGSDIENRMTGKELPLQWKTMDTNVSERHLYPYYYEMYGLYILQSRHTVCPTQRDWLICLWCKYQLKTCCSDDAAQTAEIKLLQAKERDLTFRQGFYVHMVNVCFRYFMVSFCVFN